MCSGPTGAEEILRHKFITESGIDKDKLLKKEITDPRFTGLEVDKAGTLKRLNDEPLTVMSYKGTDIELEKIFEEELRVPLHSPQKVKFN